MTRKPADHNVASRVLADPVIPVEGAKAEEPSTSTADTTVPLVAAENPTTTTARETTAPRANKRNSIFGGIFGKKEPSSTATPTTSTPATETAPAVTNKDPEPVATSPTVPQQETGVSGTAPTLDTPAPASATETAPTTTSTTSPISPNTSKANRRSSFFSNLGTKKEKRTGGVSDAEGTDGEGRKSGGFGGLLRKASRAQGPKSTSKPAASSEGATSTEAPALSSKDAPATERVTNGQAAPESTMTSTQQRPVQATA